MQTKEQLELLRHLEVGNIAPGTRITWIGESNRGDTGVILTHIGKNDDFVIHWDDNVFTVRDIDEYTNKNLRLSPLAWVQNKPVYKGDTLYWYMSGIKKPVKFVVGKHGILKGTDGILQGVSYVPDGQIFGEEGSSGIYLTQLLWAPNEKKTHRVWINLYPFGMVYVHKTKELAEQNAGNDLLDTRCIEWEAE